jgi:hypothetical protein
MTDTVDLKAKAKELAETLQLDEAGAVVDGMIVIDDDVQTLVRETLTALVAKVEELERERQKFNDRDGFMDALDADEAREAMRECKRLFGSPGEDGGWIITKGDDDYDPDFEVESIGEVISTLHDRWTAVSAQLVTAEAEARWRERAAAQRCRDISPSESFAEWLEAAYPVLPAQEASENNDKHEAAHPDWPYVKTSVQPHAGCGGTVRYYKSDGDFEDTHYRCNTCGKDWWVDGPDS